jgi:hypothetical protein
MVMTGTDDNPAENPISESTNKPDDVVPKKRRVPWWIKQGKPNPGSDFAYKKGNVPWIKGRGGLASLKGSGSVNPGCFKVGNNLGHLTKGIPKSDEWKRKASLAKIGDRNPMRNPIHAKKMADTKRGMQNPKHREFWKIHHDEQLKKMMVGEHKKPNKLEKLLIELIDRNNLPFKYVGNWEFIVAGKCPDFLCTDGRKLLIELFGNY